MFTLVSSRYERASLIVTSASHPARILLPTRTVGSNIPAHRDPAQPPIADRGGTASGPETEPEAGGGVTDDANQLGVRAVERRVVREHSEQVTVAMPNVELALPGPSQGESLHDRGCLGPAADGDDEAHDRAT